MDRNHTKRKETFRLPNFERQEAGWDYLLAANHGLPLMEQEGRIRGWNQSEGRTRSHGESFPGKSRPESSLRNFQYLPGWMLEFLWSSTLCVPPVLPVLNGNIYSSTVRLSHQYISGVGGGRITCLCNSWVFRATGSPFELYLEPHTEETVPKELHLPLDLI